MSEHRHITLSAPTVVDYKGVGGGKKEIPQRDALTHAHTLKEKYQEAFRLFEEQQNAILGEESSIGAYIDVEFDPKADTMHSLDTTNGARIMNIRSISEEKETLQATLFVPKQKEKWLEKKIDQYVIEPEENQKRKNLPLINSIENIQAARIQDFIVIKDDARIFESIPVELECEYEIWLLKEDFDEDQINHILDSIGVEVGNKTLVFESIVVLLIKATKHQLQQMVYSIPNISEIRRYRKPSVLSYAGSVSEEKEWCNSILANTIKENDPLVRVGILDSGVNFNHPLLTAFITEDRCLTVVDSIRDRENHGTSMASLALYGDLTDTIYNSGSNPITNDLLSVKVLPDNDEGHEISFYAVTTEDAISKARSNNVQILCSAVTLKTESLDGMASSVSAAIDQSLYNGGRADSLLFISAGNSQDETFAVKYPDYLLNNPILDPAQSWNAITVGAYTSKVAISAQWHNGENVLAPVGGISPYSRTSVQWGANTPIKPEIVFEGGNAYLDNQGVLNTTEDLMLVAANAQMSAHLFQGFNGTSAATALAARLAGRIKYFNPNLSALSIRALMIHSAEWTDAMQDMFTKNGELEKDILVHTCGYGIPNERKAIVSQDDYVTFISESELEPFTQGSAEPKFARMHLYQMPWPSEILRELGEQDVIVKITLSYYVEPNPGNRGKMKKHSYQSIRLNFELNQPLEPLNKFQRRVSHLGEEEPMDNDGGRWRIGIKRRNQGSISSDAIMCSAAELADCNLLAIYPSSGWYKTRKSKADVKIKYSLVVSIEAPEQDIYTEIQNKIRIQQLIPIR